MMMMRMVAATAVRGQVQSRAAKVLAAGRAAPCAAHVACASMTRRGRVNLS